MAFAEGPFNLLPSCSHRFLPWAGFFRTDGPRKTGTVLLSLQQRQRKCVGSVWAAII